MCHSRWRETSQHPVSSQFSSAFALHLGFSPFPVLCLTPQQILNHESSWLPIYSHRALGVCVCLCMCVHALPCSSEHAGRPPWWALLFKADRKSNFSEGEMLFNDFTVNAELNITGFTFLNTKQHQHQLLSFLTLMCCWKLGFMEPWHRFFILFNGIFFSFPSGVSLVIDDLFL